VIPPFEDTKAMHEPHALKQSQISDIGRNAIMTNINHDKTNSITPKIMPTFSPKADTNSDSSKELLLPPPILIGGRALDEYLVKEPPEEKAAIRRAYGHGPLEDGVGIAPSDTPTSSVPSSPNM
jgi:hypothetical protein